MTTDEATYEVYRNDTLTFQCTASRDVDGTVTPINLTGASAWMTAKRSYRDADSDAVFSVYNGGGIEFDVDLTTGEMVITVAAGWASSLPTDRRTMLVYDVQVKESGGKISTVNSGTILVKPEVTRRTTTP